MNFLVDQTENESLRLIRYIAEEGRGTAGVVYLFPINLQRNERISIQTIRSVLSELTDRNYIEIIDTPNFELTDEQRARREDEADYYFIDVFDSFYEYAKARELTADSFSSLSTSSGLDRPTGELIADLSFTSITVPTIKVSNEKYLLPSMREGAAFNAISYCLENYPNKTVKLDQLKEELKAKGMSMHGVSNIKESLRNSLFGGSNPLGIFVVVSPKGLMVKPAISLTQKELQAIIKAAK